MMPHHLSLTLAALILATPLAAQDAPTSARIIGAFTARCTAIEADPMAAVNAVFNDDAASGIISSDRARMQLTEQIDIAPGFSATLFYIGGIYAGGTEAICTLSLSTDDFGDQNPLADFPDQTAAVAEKLLGGPVTARGGPVMSKGKFGQLRVWAVETSFPPPAVMYLTQEEGYLSLSYVRSTPKAN
jgi:hypothetical protein